MRNLALIIASKGNPMNRKCFQVLILMLIFIGLLGCQPVSSGSSPKAQSNIKVIAVETFLADVAQNVAGDRLQVEALMPRGIDPHAFEATPQDVVKIANCQVLIINGAGLEEWLAKVLENAGGQRKVIEASAGLQSPSSRPGDPHFWLDPNNVIHYVENIRDGLTQIDPQGGAVFSQNAAAYIVKLKELDGWIQQEVAQIQLQRRLLVTNHESLGYFADRYQFKVIGTIIPSVSDTAAPSAMQIAQLEDAIRQSGAPAIFLETGTNPQLADQVAQDTGVKVISTLYTHSITALDGTAPTYIDMMRQNVLQIVAALK
jgi:ABC-type Zn uptake system ZnuABC Zn-binding protein ZnuA